MTQYHKNNEILSEYLLPISGYLSDPDVKEINIVEPDYLLLDMVDGYHRCYNDQCSLLYWRRLCFVLANLKGIRLCDEQFRLTCSLPDNHRFEAMMGSDVSTGLSISIRCNSMKKRQLSDFNLSIYEQNFIIDRLRQGINLIILGGTSTGKTSFLNGLLETFPEKTRMLVLEDNYEIFLGNLKYSSHYVINEQTHNPLNIYASMLNHFLRSRPDYIIFGEISVYNVLPMLRMLNSGHKGFITTMHANSPDLVVNALQSNLMISGVSAYDVSSILENCVDYIICLEKKGNKKNISQIFSVKNKKIMDI